jgi:hypothetical protein
MVKIKVTGRNTGIKHTAEMVKHPMVPGHSFLFVEGVLIGCAVESKADAKTRLRDLGYRIDEDKWDV